MTINHIFFVFMTVVGIAVGAIVAARPEVREFRLPPYFWVLIAMLAFDGYCFLRGRNVPGTMIAMEARLLGFVIGIVLMVVIPLLVGPLLRQS